jgi:hypothetical protein
MGALVLVGVMSLVNGFLKQRIGTKKISPAKDTAAIPPGERS